MEMLDMLLENTKEKYFIEEWQITVTKRGNSTRLFPESE